MKNLKFLKKELLEKANNSKLLNSKEQKLIRGGDEERRCEEVPLFSVERCYYVNGNCECRDS